MVFAAIFVSTDFIGEKYEDSEEAYKEAGFGNMMKSFTNVWDNMNGMSSWKPETHWGLFFYFALNIFINIGMLNIVISVVSDIFEEINMR